jgi:hypothetical protein
VVADKLLITESSDDMAAASSATTASPTTPTGNSRASVFQPTKATYFLYLCQMYTRRASTVTEAVWPPNVALCLSF